MNLYYFIAQRLGKTREKSFSSIVTRIAVASIAMGLAAILIAFGILLGFQEKIREKLFSLSGHMLVTKRSLNQSYEDTPISIHTYLYQNHTKIPSIEHLHVYGQKAGILKADEEVLGVILKGIGRDYDPQIFTPNLVAGAFLEIPQQGYSSDILISQEIANKLRLSLHDTILMCFVQDPPRFRKLHVQGIYQTGMEEFDKQLIIGDINLIRRLNQWPDSLAGGYEIFVKNFAELDSVAVPQVLDAMNYDMGLLTTTDRHMDIFDWLNLLNKNVAIFLGLILIVASFNMISILLIMIMERIQMIGILKAMGATNWQIRSVFIYKGILLVAQGMTLGNLIGLGFCAAQYYFELIPLDPVNYYMNTVPIEWDWSIIIGMNLLTLLVVAVVLLLPTAIISRVRPVKALRFD